MKVFKTKKELKMYLSEFRSENATIGFVPTMGALHKGHLSLLHASSKNNDLSIVSIFVNPTQFNKREDLDNYPRTLEHDLMLLEKNFCDVVFIPSIDEIYTNGVSSQHFDFDGLENEMEGKYREGHFNGVGTIVKKLFEIVLPTNAYFGEKDFQQLQIVRKLVKKSTLKVNVISCATHRETNGLAMSSRNSRLTSQERDAASIIFQILCAVKNKIGKIPLKAIDQWVSEQFEKHPLFKLEYFTIANEETLKKISEISPQKNYRAFIAVYAREVRLIDTISLNS
ncbi:MAG: pantoate--beta-alanine ligase [Flavobacteriaceae bacterium]